ncbi:MAG: hypothetical protein AAGJ35_02980 [Myxococcota bacterium]
MSKQVVRPTRPMLFQCPLCLELQELKSFRWQEPALHVTCAHCFQTVEIFAADESIHIPAAIAGSRTLKSRALYGTDEESVLDEKRELDRNTIGPLEDSCPKCGAEKRNDLDHCVQCGLVFSNVGKTFFADTDVFASHPRANTLREAWQHVQSDWQDEERHQRFLNQCRGLGAWETAGLLYRRERRFRVDDPLLAKQLERLVQIAQEELCQKPQRSRLTLWHWLWIVLLCGGMLLLVLRALHWIQSRPGNAPFSPY